MSRGEASAPCVNYAPLPPPRPHSACSIVLSELAHVIKSLGGSRRDIASCFSADAGSSGSQVRAVEE